MSDWPHPRYHVRSCTGYPLMGGPGGHTSFWVADSWYGWKEVATFHTRADGLPGHAPESARLAAAIETCARLNREHDAWLRSEDAGAPAVATPPLRGS